MERYSDRIKSALLIAQEVEQSRPRILERIKTSFPNINVKILTKYELERLNPKEATNNTSPHDYIKSLFEKAKINYVQLSGLDVTSTPTNKQHIAALRAAYNDDKLALFIGAGLSRSAGLPDWPQLVRRVAAKVFDNHAGSPLSEPEREEVQTFFEKEVPASPLIVARLLQNSLKDEFTESVREALYENIESSRTSPLLEELGKICMPRRDKTGIVAVVNYNFDDLLEQELSKKGISHCSVLSEGSKIISSDLPIYHVHGYLPRSIELESIHKESLVLTEDAYHTQFSEPFIWTNITQLNLLRNNVCLFIGISLTDPNHRRLLEITAKKNPSVNHYAIMKDHWQSSSARKLSDKGQKLATVFKQLEEKLLRNLGINVIWVENHDEIPSILTQIRNK
ncbi:hypothetical protein GCM10027048_34960 [Hymenobacter coalescens]